MDILANRSFRSSDNFDFKITHSDLGKFSSELDFGGVQGLCPGQTLAENDVARLREIFLDQLNSNLRKLLGEGAAFRDNLDFDNYHLLVDDQLHAQLFSKMNRIFDVGRVNEILNLKSFDFLKHHFGDFSLADEELIGYGQITYRMVRPRCRSDVGALHKDAWFWDFYHTQHSSLNSRVKVWLQLSGDPYESGLLFKPGSHLKEIHYEIESSANKVSFITSNISSEDLVRFTGSLGTPIFFNYGLLHGGSVNYGEKCRASLEFTILRKNNA